MTNHAKIHLFHVLKLPKRQVVSSHNEWQNEYESGFSAIFCGFTFIPKKCVTVAVAVTTAAATVSAAKTSSSCDGDAISLLFASSAVRTLVRSFARAHSLTHISV